MTRNIVLLLAITLAIANAHTYLSSVTVGGVDQGERNCLRPLYGGNSPGMYRNSPIMDVKLLTGGLSSDNMTCGFLPYAATPANRKCSVAAGSKMGLTWKHDSTAASDDIIESSHVGPCMVYMAQSETGSGAVWFKVYEEGYVSGQWCSMRVKAAKGYMEFTIPSTLPPGNYLVRGEIIALHDGDKLYGAQPYVSCAEITLTGSGNVAPAASYMVDMTKAYKLDDPGIRFNIYNAYSTYPIPGPTLYTAAAPTGTGTGTGTGTQTTTTTTTTTQQTQQPTQPTQPTQQTTTTTATQQPTQNGCGDVTTQCIALCGTRGVNKCSCVNNQPLIECADASSASTLKPFWFL